MVAEGVARIGVVGAAGFQVEDAWMFGDCKLTFGAFWWASGESRQGVDW